MAARYALADVPPSAETDRSRFALNRSASGQQVATARAQTLAWQALADELESSLEPVRPPVSTVTVPRIVRTGEGAYELAPDHIVVTELQTYRPVRTGKFGSAPEKRAGGLVDDLLASPEALGSVRDEVVAEAFRAAAEREQATGYDLTLLNKLMLRILTLRVGVKLDLSRY